MSLIIEATLEDMRQDYNWDGEDTAFSYAEGFTIDDVEEVIASANGEHDGDSWIAVFKLKDGKYAGLTAGCDYTGWD
jgi:hypothetical protein